MADLDHPGVGMFTEIGQSRVGIDSHPSWSPDGNQLAWSSTDPASGLTSILVWNVQNPNIPPHWTGSGDWPVWLDNEHIATRINAPNQSLLTSYSVNGTVALPPILLAGNLNGFSFGRTNAAIPGPFQANAQFTPAPLYAVSTTPQPSSLPGRASLISLLGVHVPFPQLHASAYDSFQALRSQVALETGWDALASLENAFVPLTTSLDPGLGEDWLYTGRAITLNPAQIQAGWMAIIREDFGQQTYWHIFLKTTAQDGSRGMPLTQVPWDFNARTGDPAAYENGGKLMSTIPTGYWVDLTNLAIQYGWERLPALPNWRTYYAGARFNELAFTQELDWYSAMLQLYPPEILVTPTVVIPSTRTPTRTPLWYRTPTPTRTPTLHPTNTP